ncbi:unnamed protein product [Rhizoctonia solani]|uniref:Uncharacterized protein n=1 Tax=Rhizoctonia solani TaxID=456999 RepID=A0A8H3DAY4_9AGAM|nr:unnamed protein product [Rhizoctonia solani]
MPSGTNWMGGRGHVKKAKRQSGLKILEHGGNTEQHFAKLRAVTSNLIVQGQSNRDTSSKATPLVSFRHAQSDSQGPAPVHAARTEDDVIHPSASVFPRILDRPNKPTKQNRLSELMETAVKNIESLDAKRAHINSMDARSLAGLDIASRKRKYGVAPDGQGQVTSKPFYYPAGAKPRAFAASPSPEPLLMVDTCAGYVEDMLSFGTPSDKQSANGTQAPIIYSNGEVRDEQVVDQHQTNVNIPPVSTTPMEPQSSTNETDIPPTLYEDAFREAARTLKLQDALLGVQINTSLSPWHTRPNEDDSEIRTFNLFTPAQVNVPDGISFDPEPRTAITAFQEEWSPRTRLSAALGKENRLDIGNQIGSNLKQDLHDHNQQHAGGDRASDLPVKPHEKPRLETPQGTKPPPPQPPRKPTGKDRNNSGRGSIPLSPLDRCVLRSHPSRSRRISDPAALPSDHSNAHERSDGVEPIVTAKSVPSLGDSRAIDFASAGSSPSSSQEIGVSLTTRDDQGDGHHRTIGLQLFDDHPQADLEMTG